MSKPLSLLTRSVSADSHDILRCAETCGIAVAAADPESISGFNFSRYFARLRTRALGTRILYAETLPSTQNVVNSFRDIEDIACIADVQTQGRGRGDNAWVSPEGCLMFSFSSSIKEGRLLPYFQYVVSLAAVRASMTLTGLREDDASRIRIKWPNDLYSGKLKVGGVLCNSTQTFGGDARSMKFSVITGVGLNVLNENPTTSLAKICVGDSHRISREDALAEFFNEMETLRGQLVRGGFSSLEGEYTRTWMHSGQTVDVVPPPGSEDSKALLRVTITGIDKDGMLLATAESGERLQLHPDGNRLDMMTGLIAGRRT